MGDNEQLYEINGELVKISRGFAEYADMYS